MKMTSAIPASILVLLALLAPAFAHAQASRTWVSGVGDDANPCSRTAPCKTLAGTISKTAAGGIINLIDSGGIGAVTITKSITIQMQTPLAGVLAAGTNGIIINAAATDVVVLRGLAIHGFGTGLNGVRILQAGTVRIENCDIQDFVESGIEAANSTPLKLTVDDTSIERILAAGGAAGPNDGGVLLAPTGAGSVRAVFNNVRIHGVNQWGINMLGNIRLTLHDSVISGVTGSALRVDGSVGSAQVLLDNASLIDNTGNGILSTGAVAVARVSNSVMSGNNQAMNAINSGQIITFGNNVFAGNANNGTSTSAAVLQ
jgi:hypothetical protein